MPGVERSWAVDAGGVALVVCVHPVMVMCGFRGCWSSFGVAVCFTHLVVGWSWSFVGRLLSFLGSWDCVSRWASCDITLGRCGGELDVGCHWVVCRGCGGIAGVVVVS